MVKVSFRCKNFLHASLKPLQIWHLSAIVLLVFACSLFLAKTHSSDPIRRILDIWTWIAGSSWLGIHAVLLLVQRSGENMNLSILNRYKRLLLSHIFLGITNILYSIVAVTIAFYLLNSQSIKFYSEERVNLFRTVNGKDVFIAEIPPDETTSIRLPKGRLVFSAERLTDGEQHFSKLIDPNELPHSNVVHIRNQLVDSIGKANSKEVLAKSINANELIAILELRFLKLESQLNEDRTKAYHNIQTGRTNSTSLSSWMEMAPFENQSRFVFFNSKPSPSITFGEYQIELGTLDELKKKRKKDLENFIGKVDALRYNLKDLHEKNVSALKKGNLVYSHELTTQIHSLLSRHSELFEESKNEFKPKSDYNDLLLMMYNLERPIRTNIPIYPFVVE
jgi:hypothetical protein